jgi:hypothetical protein
MYRMGRIGFRGRTVFPIPNILFIPVEFFL